MFLDEAIIDVRSGKGGDGSAAFRQEKHVPRGGPSGGDGGKGGDVVLVAEKNKRTLLDFRFTRKYKAEDGAKGMPDQKYGKSAKSIRLEVPIGTTIKDADTGETLADLTYDNAKFIACKGGRGGKGNMHFTSSVRQAPTFAEKGEPGRHLKLLLELRLMADVGLVGLPNAGKSTLISAISAAKPRIADYPFTTLTPNLGIVRAGEDSFVVADLPGLIEGASEGKGLGHRFLKHTERTRVVLHVVDCAPLDESDPVENYKLICHELAAYSGTLASKPSLVALSKTDVLPDKAKLGEIIARLEGVATEIHPISAATKSGLDPLVFRLAAILKDNPPDDVVPILQPQPQDEREKFAVIRDNGNYVIEGEAVVRLIAMTNLGNSEALRHLHRKLIGMGVIAELKSRGAEDGDTVRIGEFAFTYLEEE